MEEPLKDAAGLLERAPELIPVANASASVQRGLARGNLHAVYRTLWWTRRLGRLPEHRPALDALLAHRRLFAMPVRRMPVLNTVNGLGASVYGRHEPDADGTYLKTHFLVFIFMPVFPLSQYLVQDAGNGGWYFLAKVPMSPLLRLWNRLVVAALLGGLALGAVRTFHATRNHDVHVVNGLPIAVRAVVGKVRYDIPPRQRRTASVPTGTHAVSVTDAAGRPIESGTMDVVAGTDILAWNVLGAAPVYERTVFYTSTPVPRGKEAEPRFLCGQQALRVAGVDYAFTEPPATVQLPKGQNGTQRKQLGLAAGDLDVCVRIIAGAGKPQAALTLGKALGAFDTDPHIVRLACALYSAGGQPEEARAVARRAAEQHPESVEHHRVYQGCAGRELELREEYRERYAASPGSPDAGYLYARLLPNSESFPLGRSLLERHPDHVPLHRIAILGSVRRLEFAEAVGRLEHLRRLDAVEWAHYVEDHVLALAALRRTDDAIRVAQEGFAAAGPATQVRLAAFTAWMAGGAGPVAEGLLRRLGPLTADDSRRFRVRFWTAPAGEAPASPATGADALGHRMSLNAHYDPRAALEQAARLPAEHLLEMDNEVLLLLLGEAVHAGHAEARKQLEAAAEGSSLPLTAVHAYLDKGTWSDAIDDLPVTAHGALHLARARGHVPDRERERLRDLAGRCDPLGGWVRKALDQWPAP